MLIQENLEISGKPYVKSYSDEGFYLMSATGALYREAFDPEYKVAERAYVETDEKIEGEQA